MDGHRLQISLDCGTERQALAQLALFAQDPHSYKTPSQRDAEARRQAQETADNARLEAEARRRQDEHEAAYLNAASVARFLEHIKDRTAKYKKDTRYLSAWADALQGRDLRKVEPREVLRLLAPWDTAEQKRIAALKAFCSFLVKTQAEHHNFKKKRLNQIERRLHGYKGEWVALLVSLRATGSCWG